MTLCLTKLKQVHIHLYFSSALTLQESVRSSKNQTKRERNRSPCLFFIFVCFVFLLFCFCFVLFVCLFVCLRFITLIEYKIYSGCCMAFWRASNALIPTHPKKGAWRRRSGGGSCSSISATSTNFLFTTQPWSGTTAAAVTLVISIFSCPVWKMAVFCGM